MKFTLIAFVLLMSSALFGTDYTCRIVDAANSKGWSGTTVDAWISAAQSNLPTGGGCIDATGLGASSQTWAAPLTIGSSTKAVTIIFDKATYIQFTSTGAGCQVTITGGSSVIARGKSQVLSGQGGGWQLTSSADVSNLICLTNQATGAGFDLEGISILSSTATVTDAVINLTDPTEIAQINGITVGKHHAPLLKITQNSGDSVSGLAIINSYFDCGGFTTCTPVYLAGVTGGGSWGGVNFFGGSYVHPQSGGAIIDCEGTSSDNTAGGVNMYGPYFESSGSNDVAVYTNNCHGVHIHDPFFSSGGTPGKNCLEIAGTSDGIDMTGADNFNAWTNNVKNDVNGKTYASSNGNRFEYHYVRGSLTYTNVWDDASGTNGHIDSSGVCGKTSCN